MENNVKKVYGIQVTCYTWDYDLEKYMLSYFRCDRVVFQTNCVLLIRDGSQAVERIECDRLVKIEVIMG